MRSTHFNRASGWHTALVILSISQAIVVVPRNILISLGISLLSVIDIGLLGTPGSSGFSSTFIQFFIIQLRLCLVYIGLIISSFLCIMIKMMQSNFRTRHKNIKKAQHLKVALFFVDILLELILTQRFWKIFRICC